MSSYVAVSSAVEERTSASSNHGELRETNVVADTDTNLAKVWWKRNTSAPPSSPPPARLTRLHDRDLVPSRQRIALPEPDPARHIDIKQVHLAVQSLERAVRGERRRRVVDPAVVRALRDRSCTSSAPSHPPAGGGLTADQPDASLLRRRAEHLDALRLTRPDIVEIGRAHV